MRSPLTLPEYSAPPRKRQLVAAQRRVGDGSWRAARRQGARDLWKVCVSVSSPCGVFHVPATFAGTK